MNYFEIPGEPQAIVWKSGDGNSGVVREGTAGWDEFCQWLSAGNVPESIESSDSRSLDQLRSDARGLIAQAATQAFEPFTRLYPRAEMDSWPEQCSEANAWLANPLALTPLTDAIYGVSSSEEKRGVCTVILSKANNYKATVGAVIAWRRKMTAWVEAQDERTTLISFAPRYPEVPNAS